MQKNPAKFELDHLIRSRQIQVGWFNIATFDEKRTITRKRYKIDAVAQPCLSQWEPFIFDPPPNRIDIPKRVAKKFVGGD